MLFSFFSLLLLFYYCMWCVVKCLLRFSVQIKSSFICLNASFWLAKHLTLLSSICVVTACPNLHLPGINGQKLFFLGKKIHYFWRKKIILIFGTVLSETHCSCYKITSSQKTKCALPLFVPTEENNGFVVVAKVLK